MIKRILRELKSHGAFTAFGALTGIIIMLLVVWTRISQQVSAQIFWMLHPLHVVLSALVTVSMYRLHTRGGGRIWTGIVVGYVGSVGIATLSDCVIPYLGELLLGLPNRGIHLGFIEKPWLVNSLAGVGIAIAYFRPTTKFPHAGHVLLSTWASLFHMIMALGEGFTVLTAGVTAVFLFIAVWVPCCTSDIVFPLLFARE